MLDSLQGEMNAKQMVLAFDTSNEVIALGLGHLDAQRCAIDVVTSVKLKAHRASNTQLLPHIDAMLADVGLTRSVLACVACGRGPGSFTGVRIAMATAKGIASALSVGLIGISTAESVVWGAQRSGVRGTVAVVANAMRKEVYPARFAVSDDGVVRLDPDAVMKLDKAVEFLGTAQAQGEELVGAEGSASSNINSNAGSLFLTGDALYIYRGLFESCGSIVSEALWTPTGEGLLCALEAAWRAGETDPFDTQRHNPAFVLPIYTRLSDAEEGERSRLAHTQARDLVTGVQGDADAGTAHKSDKVGEDSNNCVGLASAHTNISLQPLDAAHASAVAALESRIMGSDAWNKHLIIDDLARSDRTWWAAYALDSNDRRAPRIAITQGDAILVGYAGGWVVDGDMQILKLGVDPAWRRCGIARRLVSHIALDARDLGAQTCSLEVRISNTGAQACYKSLGLVPCGIRPHYYSDREDALIMKGSLPIARHGVAGMELEDHAITDKHAVRAASAQPLIRPLILAIETSCDETAAALVDGSGVLHADVVASQVDFHARFGGVVPEIASRKHIEAICGVCDECLEAAAFSLGHPRFTWTDIDAVAATYAPGLVGALVVGLAFAKGVSWALDVPFIGVNHLEGHLYANKIGSPDFTPPALVSLVSGGNTMLVYMRAWGDYTTLGATIDDAVGEAFDKVAKALGLGYPGGPIISKLAAQGNSDAIAFPRAMLHSGDLRFSLSGLKTAVNIYIEQERMAKRALNLADVAASFQQAVIDVQIAKAQKALDETGAPTLCLGGGVAANPALREAYEQLCANRGVRLVLPPLSSCGDNAGMIALAALDRYRAGRFFGLDADACAHTCLDDPY